jgi:hypothetical protein
MKTHEMHDLKAAVRAIRRTRKLARRARRRLGWGCVLALAQVDAHTVGWQITAISGERVWLTAEMLRAVEGQYWWLQGSTPCTIAEIEGRPDCDLSREIAMVLYHSPISGDLGRSVARMTRTTLTVGDAPVVLLAPSRPPSWPG